MSYEPRPVSLEETANWIRDAAVSKSWRPSHQSGPIPVSITEIYDVHFELIQSSLLRARSKTFVRAIKPLRRILRNQGAVNDSLIEAVHHLAAQNQKMLEQMNDLRRLVSKLSGEMPRPERRTTAESPSGEERKISPGKEMHSSERSSSPAAGASDRTDSCA
jgi:hypothetical protein